MALSLQEDFSREGLLSVARAMANAARTAPKAIGQDLLEIAIVDGAETEALADQMTRMCKEGRAGAHFMRDAENLRASSLCVLIGTRIVPEAPRDCARCGILECANNRGYMGSPCIFATHDLGLAVGSAVSVAADFRADNRVMYSVGAAAVELNFLGEKVRLCMGIPLSVSGKSPYFDRAK